MRLSIIVPAYNMEDYLAKCLDSVIYPELTDYEVIVVDDGSTDRTAEIAADYAARFPALLRLISTENGGLGQARNVGLEAASGEFVVFLDSDDYYCENAVGELLETTRQDIDICLFDLQAVSADGRPLERLRGSPRLGAVSLESCPELLMAYPSGCNKLCRRSLFMDSGIRFPGRVWYEDLRTMPKLYLLTDRIVANGRAWYMYLSRPGSIINTAGIERSLEIIDAVDDLTEYYRERGALERYRAELEYLAYYNQFLTASVRICMTAPESPVLDRLRDDFLRKHPNCEGNPYIRRMSAKHRLLGALLMKKRRSAVGSIMKLNRYLKTGG